MPDPDPRSMRVVVTITLDGGSGTLIVLSKLAQAGRVSLEMMIAEAIVWGASQEAFWNYIKRKYLLSGRRLGGSKGAQDGPRRL